MRYLKPMGLNSNEPIGRGFNFPYDTAFSSDGRIFVLNRSNGPRVHMCTFDEEWLGEFGAGPSVAESLAPDRKREGVDQLEVPTALAFNSEDLLFVTDEALNEIKVFDDGGGFVRNIGTDLDNGESLGGPSGIAIDSEDNLYVVEQTNNRVHKMSPKGESILMWGEEGAGDGQFNLPWGVGLDSEDNVYVADWRNDRIQKFTPNGGFLATFGEPGDGQGQFHRPSSVSVDDEGYMYVADWENERVQILSPEGSFHEMLHREATLSKWALEWLEVNQDEFELRKASDLAVTDLPSDMSTPYYVGSQTEHLFWGPVSVKLDAEDRMYVAEHSRHRIQIYEKD